MIKRIINFILGLFGLKLADTKNDVINKKTSSYCKKRIMSNEEIKFYNLLNSILENKYIIWPQINLAAVINKKNDYNYSNNYRKFQTELFRNIDFGIFDKETLDLLLLIELNDNTHNNLDRKKRDNKVKEICNKCGYNIISFWLNKPNKPEYVKNRVLYYLGVLDTKIDNTQELESLNSNDNNIY